MAFVMPPLVIAESPPPTWDVSPLSVVVVLLFGSVLGSVSPNERVTPLVTMAFLSNPKGLSRLVATLATFCLADWLPNDSLDEGREWLVVVGSSLTPPHCPPTPF